MNKLIKLVLIAGVHLLALLECCILGWVIGCAVTSAVLSVWSAISPLPEVLCDKFWLATLISGAVPSLAGFLSVEYKRK